MLIVKTRPPLRETTLHRNLLREPGSNWQCDLAAPKQRFAPDWEQLPVAAGMPLVLHLYIQNNHNDGYLETRSFEGHTGYDFCELATIAAAHLKIPVRLI